MFIYSWTKRIKFATLAARRWPATRCLLGGSRVQLSSAWGCLRARQLGMARMIFWILIIFLWRVVRPQGMRTHPWKCLSFIVVAEKRKC